MASFETNRTSKKAGVDASPISDGSRQFQSVGMNSPPQQRISGKRASGPVATAGVGVVINKLVREDGSWQYFIERVVSGGPAEKSNIVRAGDILVAIDDQSIENTALDWVVSLIKGSEGTPILLALLRNNSVVSNGTGKGDVIAYSVTLERMRVEG